MRAGLHWPDASGEVSLILGQSGANAAKMTTAGLPIADAAHRRVIAGFRQGGRSVATFPLQMCGN
jgi:hypothetical protein